MASVKSSVGSEDCWNGIVQDVQRIPGILDEHTLEHLLDVELARARRYEHPFCVLRVRSIDLGALREVTGALRLHTRWADSVGVIQSAALLVILRDTDLQGAQTAVVKIKASLTADLSEAIMQSVIVETSAWRKGDDRARLLARLD
jgi:hypothetical protein